MKTNCCELLLSFLLAFAIITNAFLGGGASSDAVLDLAGEQMQVTNAYFIERPLFRPTTGATLVRGVNETCPIHVGPVPLNGIPARFSPVNSNDTVVREYTDLNIIFYFAPPPRCAGQSSVWKVQYDEESEEYFVRVGILDGVEGNPSCWFKIEKLGDYYKLVFCPSVCNNPYCNFICKDVGVDSLGRFVLCDTPYPVVFRKFHVPKSMISYQY